jgi:uncharacterized protein (TIGR03086 family)
MTTPTPSAEQLGRALDAVGNLIAAVGDQWSAATPCTEWTVRDLVGHLVQVNRTFVAVVNGQTPPDRGADVLGDDPVAAYRDSSAALRAAFDQPGILDRKFEGPLGTATGAARLQWRIADLLAHGWDLGQALGRPADLPADLVEQAHAFALAELPGRPRTGRFGEPQPVADDAPVLDRYVAFLGRPVN